MKGPFKRGDLVWRSYECAWYVVKSSHSGMLMCSPLEDLRQKVLFHADCVGRRVTNAALRKLGGP